MAVLNLVYGPDPIFTKQASLVVDFDNSLKKRLKDMADTLYHHKALGIGANMVGILDQLIVVDIQQDGKKNLYKMVNPVITYYSEETDLFMEASLSFPGIQAKIKRSKIIDVDYYSEEGVKNSLKAEGMLARVIQHEVDYLQGKTFLDYLSPVKRKMLLLKLSR
jgi:peptide deformylase